MADHVRCVHGKKKYSCDFCDKMFEEKTFETAHERPYLCQNFGDWFREKSDMTEHLQEVLSDMLQISMKECKFKCQK